MEGALYHTISLKRAAVLVCAVAVAVAVTAGSFGAYIYAPPYYCSTRGHRSTLEPHSSPSSADQSKGDCVPCPPFAVCKNGQWQCHSGYVAMQGSCEAVLSLVEQAAQQALARHALQQLCGGLFNAGPALPMGEQQLRDVVWRDAEKWELGEEDAHLQQAFDQMKARALAGSSTNRIVATKAGSSLNFTSGEAVKLPLLCFARRLVLSYASIIAALVASAGLCVAWRWRQQQQRKERLDVIIDIACASLKHHPTATDEEISGLLFCPTARVMCTLEERRLVVEACPVVLTHCFRSYPHWRWMATNNSLRNDSSSVFSRPMHNLTSTAPPPLELEHFLFLTSLLSLKPQASFCISLCL